MGIEIPHMCYHYTFISEFLWKILEPNDMSKCFSIVDCKNVGFSDFAGDVKTYLTAINEISGLHYPERCFRIFVVNAPWVFSTIWSLLKAVIDPVTAAKVHIFNSIAKAKDEFMKYIDPENLPLHYGGPCQCGSDEIIKSKEDNIQTLHSGCAYYSEEETQLRELVEKVNQEWKDNPESKEKTLKDTIVMNEEQY